MLFTIGSCKSSGSTYVFSHNYAGVKIDSYDSLPLGKILTFHNVVILIKAALNRDPNY